MYGTFIVDPKQGRPEADEMVMVQHGYNTTFDAEGNQLYAVNGIPFHYMNEPIQVERDELVRIYLVNMLEYDPINSFHVHGELLRLLPDRHVARSRPSSPTRSSRARPSAGSASCASRTPGRFMFHAHKTEFAELGWMGFFEVG